MHPITFSEANTNFGSPEKIGGKDILTIPAYVGEDEHNPGAKYVVTQWQPSEKDKIAIAEGRPINLQCWGGLPPVSLYTCDENGNLNEDENFL